MSEGVTVRHRKGCGSRGGLGCDCRPGYQAQVYSERDRYPIRKTFATLSEARAWRAKAHMAVRQGTLGMPCTTTLEEAAESWMVCARAGVIRTRSGDRYKPSALRGYEQALRTRLLPELGSLKLSAISRNAVQDLVDQMIADGLSASTACNAVLPLRAIYRRAMARRRCWWISRRATRCASVPVRKLVVGRPWVGMTPAIAVRCGFLRQQQTDCQR